MNSPKSRRSRRVRRVARQPGRGLAAADLQAALMLPAKTDPEALRRSSAHKAARAIATPAPSTGVLRCCVVGLPAGTASRTFFDPTGRDATRDRTEDRLQMLLSGRATELTEVGSCSAGAGFADFSDLAPSTCMLTALNARGSR